MSAGVWLSSGAFRTRSLAGLLDVADAEGFDRIELGSGLEWADDLLEQVHRAAARCRRFMVHNYFPPPREPFVLNLAAVGAADRARSLDHCRRAVDLARSLGEPLFSVHAGFAAVAGPGDLGRDLTGVPRVPLEQAHEAFVASLRTLCEYGAGAGVRILVENNVVAPFNLVGGRNLVCLGATASELQRTLDEVAHPNLGVLVDTGHLKVSASALGFDAHAFLDVLAPRIGGFHLSDNDGTKDTNETFADDAWFIPRLAEFPDVPMVVEAYRLQPGEMRRALDVVARARARRVAV